MNTIIIYASRYGGTAACAKLVKSGLPGTVALFDIEKITSEGIRLEGYDTVIFGSSIYVGAISKKMRIFCKENVDILSQKRVGIFLCCAFANEINEYFSRNFPAALLEKAIAIKGFGGEARIDKMKAIDKLIMKMVTKGNYENLIISQENIEKFIAEMSISQPELQI